MKNGIIYQVISETDEDKLAKAYKNAMSNIDPNKYENIRTEYSTTFQIGSMKFGKVVHSILILATQK